MTRRISTIAALALMAIATTQPAFRQDKGSVDLPDGPPVLRKALANAPNLRYAGTRIVEFRRNGSTDRHEETITRDGPFVRIEFPDGSPMAGQIIVENSIQRRHYFPDLREIHILPPRRDEAYERLARMLSGGKGHVTVTTAPGTEVAGIRTEQVVISDRSGNVFQRLYIDPDSGVILKRELYDQVGTPVGSFEFKNINLSPRINRRVFRILVKGAKIMTPADLLERLAKEKDFSPTALPLSSGYRLENSYVRAIDGKDVLVENYTSQEGRRLTLFQLKAAISSERLKMFGKRDDVKSVTWQALGSTFVLVGNLDESTLLRIARPLNGGN